MDKRSILTFVLFLIAQECKPVTAEWVEIPQFSNGEKVYREPFNKYGDGQKLHVGSTKPPAIHRFRNVTAATIHGFDKIHANKHLGLSQTWITKPTDGSLSGVDSSQTAVTEETVYLSGIDPWSTVRPPQNIGNFPESSQFGDATVEEEDDEYVTVSTIHPDDRITVDKEQSDESNGATYQETPDSEEDSNSNASFLYFIPVQLFKKVHATLKAQPATLKGKIVFLKNFETALLAEIQKRLAPIVAPVRKKRDSRGDHGWDDHDDSVGFPSLEGALMSICFLTFGVYLVQMVMMLFRNLGAATTPATGTATVVFNRNKRSVTEFTEDTARVLEYLDKYDKTRYIDD